MPYTARTPTLLHRSAAALILLAAQLTASTVSAQTDLFRIGTGGEKGTYFLVGSLIADALTDNRKGCTDASRSCGVPGLLAVPQLSNGSVANLEAMSAGVLEAGLVQADIAHQAFNASGEFAAKPDRSNVRAIANLYSETVHVVVASAAGIDDIAALRGRRVSLDELGSGTLVDARLILAAHGLLESDLQPFYIKPHFAAQRMSRGELDAFFIVAGHPTPSVTEAVLDGPATLLGIDAEHAALLATRHPNLYVSEIPAGTYPGVGATPTLAVGALLVVNADLDEELVYQVTAALWSERAARLLAGDHPKSGAIVIDHALRGIGLPLHPGAARFYSEQGMEPEHALPPGS